MKTAPGGFRRVGDGCWLGDVLTAFEARTGAQAILNTSLNVMGKPIVHSPQDALAVLVTSGLDALLIDDLMFAKDEG